MINSMMQSSFERQSPSMDRLRLALHFLALSFKMTNRSC